MMPATRIGWTMIVLWGLLVIVPGAWAAPRTTILAVPAAESARTDLATLVLPEAIDIQQVDGLEYPGMGSVLRRGDLPVRVLPGEREVALRYNQLFQTTADEHDIVKSRVIVLRFRADPGVAYRVVHPRFRDAREAREGVKNLVLSIEDPAGNNRVLAASQVATGLSGQEAVSTTRPDLVSKSAVNEAAAAKEAVPVASVTEAGTATPQGGVNALELLKFTWQNASAEDRAAFLRWARENP